MGPISTPASRAMLPPTGLGQTKRTTHATPNITKPRRTAGCDRGDTRRPMTTIASCPSNVVIGNGKNPPSPAAADTPMPTVAANNGIARRHPMLGAHATATSNRNIAPSGLNIEVASAAKTANQGRRRRTARTDPKPKARAHAKGPCPTTTLPTTKTANHSRASAVAQLRGGPTNLPNSQLEQIAAIEVAGIAPTSAPKAGKSTLYPSAACPPYQLTSHNVNPCARNSHTR